MLLTILQEPMHIYYHKESYDYDENDDNDDDDDDDDNDDDNGDNDIMLTYVSL